MSAKPYQEYKHPDQRGIDGPDGTAMMEHHEENGLLARAFTFDDPLVQQWLTDPATFPAELKKQSCALLGSLDQNAAEPGKYAVLKWDDRHQKVVESWRPLSDRFNGYRCSLLHPAA